MNPALDISSYIASGFVKVCEVTHGEKNKWYYINVNEDYMFAEHRSWVYLIVDNNEIVKVGETGQPLGIMSKWLYPTNEEQPIPGSKSRFGRLANHYELYDTDHTIRDELAVSVSKKVVSLWAKKCEVMKSAPIIINGQEITATLASHKHLEKQILDYILSESGKYPLLNKGRA